MDENIIVVEDQRNYLESIRRRLATAGFQNIMMESDPCKTASLFEEGGAFDIALLDVTMPGMNGIEMLEIVRKSSPATECLMITVLDEAQPQLDFLLGLFISRSRDPTIK